MSAFSDALSDKLKKNLGADIVHRNNTMYAANIGHAEPAEPTAVSKALGTIGELANAWGQNVQNAYDNSPMYGDIRGAGNAWDADTSYKDPSSYYDNNTFAGSFANAAIGGSAGVIGGIADMLGAEKLGDRAAAVQEATRDTNAISPEFSWDYFTNPHGLIRSTGNTVGSMATLAPAMALMPEATAMNIAARLGGNKGVQFLIDKGYTHLAKRFAQTLPNAVRWTGTTSGLESLAEGGGTVREAKELGLDDPYGRGWKTAAENLPGLIASNLAEGLILGGIGKAKPGSSLARRLGTIPASALGESAQNSLEEGYQQAIQNINLGKPITEGMSEAMKEGFFGSLLLGGMGGTYHAANANRIIDPETTQEFIDWLNGANPAQDYSQYNPMTDPNREAERNSDIPSPLGFDITEADPSDVMKWLNKQSAFNGVDNVASNVDNSQAQQGQSSSLPTGNEVSGENSLDGFDKRFMSKYESKPGATDLANVQAKVKSAFNGLAAEYGDGLIVTGGAEKGYHAAGENGHEGGWKIDVDKASVKDPQKFLALCKKYGFAVGDEGDHFDLSGHAKGGVGGTQVVTPDTFISDGGQVQSAQPTGKREGHANAWAITDVFRRAGYNDEAIAGILGRVQQEHNFDTSDVPEHEEEGMHVGGYGMFQWNGGRTTAFLEWAKQNGKDPQNPTTQAEYALKEAQERGITPDKMNKLSAEEAADLWTKDWEVGVAGKERQYAGEWRERLKNGGGGTNSITPQDFGNILGNHMIDFAGSEDDNLANSYQRIMDNLADDAKSVLANRFANLYSNDGTFNNTAENRTALAQDEQSAEIIKTAAEQFAPQLIAPLMDKQGRINKQTVKDYFTPQIAGQNLQKLKDAIKSDKLSNIEKSAILEEAGNQLNVPRPKLGDNGQAKFVNDLQKAIDSRDFGKIYSMMPTETAKAVANVRQPMQAMSQVQPAPIQEQPIAPVEQQEVLPAPQPTVSNQEQVAPVEQYNPDTAQNAVQTAQAMPEVQTLPNVPTEQENAQTAQQVANKAQQIANIQRQDFNTRLAELQAMPLGQLEQLGQQTLNAMQTAGLPVNEALANGLTAGKENAIALAESRLAEAGVNPTGSNQEQVENVASQATKEPTPSKEPKALKQFREKADKVVARYRNDKLTYEEAFSKLEEMYIKADNLAKTKEEHDAVAQIFLSAGENLERIRQEKSSAQQKPDYSNMSLDELKAERQRLIDEEVDRMKRNPGGKGVNVGYTQNERGEINGRYAESNNPDWYQKAYKKLGRKPKVSEYQNIATDNLKEIEEFARLEDAIARLEQEESAKNAPTPKQDKASENREVKPAKSEVEPENAFGMSADDVWGDPDEARAKMENLLGLKPIKQEKSEQKENKPAKNKKTAEKQSTFQERREANKEEFEKELAEAKKAWNKASSKLSAMPMFNPELYSAAAGLAKVYVKYGVKEFADFAREAIKEVGDGIRAWLRPAWAMATTEAEAGYDTDALVAVADYIGNYMKGDKHKASLDEVTQHFADTYGKEAADKYKTLLHKAHAGVYVWYNNNKEVTDDELYDSTGESSEQDSAGENQNPVGEDDGRGKSGSGGGRSVRADSEDSRTRDSGSVHGRSTSRSGETSDSGVQGSKSGRSGRNSTGGKQLTGSRRDSFERKAIDDGRSAEGLGTAKNRRDNAGTANGKAKTITVTSDTFKVGDSEQIAKSMPNLFAEQVDDVVKADTRLYANNGEGMMFTNGTGTGKTFTGLGCIKRAVQQGKKNILIVAPSNKVQLDWIKSGKMFFGLDITQLENTKDAGKGIVITSYENLADNNSLVKRDWDMVVADESHKLMNNEKGEMTNALEGVRALTYHHKGYTERAKRTYPEDFWHEAELSRIARGGGLSKDEQKSLSNLNKKIKDGKKLTERDKYNLNILQRVANGDTLTDKEKAELKQLSEINAKRVVDMKGKFASVNQEDKPKVVFLSATPFSYVPDVEYAEGYLFHYDKSKDNNGGYNQANGRGDFFIKHFGYRMRTGKLTKPDADVNTDLMEINFNKWLKKEGVLSGRTLKVDKDYDRGYVLVNSGIGKQIDDGMKVATEEGVPAANMKYGLCHDLFQNKLRGNNTRYLLEGIKAKESIDLIKQYIAKGKKVVLFHQFKENEPQNPFILTDKDFKNIQDETDRNRAKQQYSRFVKDHPELVNLDIKDLKNPIDTLMKAFGNQIRKFNGDVSEKNREKYVNEFQDDDSQVKIIICQRDAAKEGISLHDITGKHQRVLIDLGLPTKPTDLIQCEGRIYRTGVKSDAIFRYLNTGTLMEKRAFASVISDRAATAENLAMGDEARALRSSLVEGFMESVDGDAWKKYLPNTETEGKGGKERDSKLMDGVSQYEAAKSDYFANQKKNSRNKAQEGIDYFPTPEPIGFKMVEWLGLKPGDRALEPSAGHGAISRYFGTETRNTIVEPSAELATLAKMRLAGNNSRVFNDVFEKLEAVNHYEGIPMNPPYGQGGKTAYEHVAKAYKHLAEGGRLIAIVPDGPAANKRFEDWFFNENDKELKKAVLMGEIKLPQVTFKRAGTGVATKIIVIDKYSDEADRAKANAEAKGTIDFTAINDINKLFDRMENMTFPERVGADIPRHFTTTVNKAGGEVLTQVAMPDNLELLKDDRLRQMAGNFKGRVDTKYGGFKFKYDEHRAKFIRAANRYLAGKEELAEEQQEIIDDTLTPAETEHFKGGDYKDADGTSKPQAAIKGNLKYNLYQEVKKIAQQNNGSYSKGARGFVFDNAADRDNFLKKAEAFFSEKASYSAAPGETMTTDELNKLWNDTAEVVSEDKLTGREKELQSIAQSMGAQLEFVTCSPKIQGKYDPTTGISYINRNAAHNSAPWVAWHEMFHWIKRNNETLFNKLVEHIKTKAPFSKTQLDKYREAIGRPDISDEVVIEEMMADAFPDVRKRVPFFRDLAKENVSLYKRLVAFVKRVIDDIVSRFYAGSKDGRGLNAQQVALMHNAFCDMVRDIRGADGKPIFKVNKDGYRQITDMDGNTTEQILEAYSLAEAENNLNSAKYSIDNHMSLGHNKLKKRAEFANRLTNRVTFDENGYPKVDVMFEFSQAESPAETLERRMQELYFIDGRLGADTKEALINLLGDRRAEVDNRIRNSSVDEAIATYRDSFDEIISNYPVGATAEEEGRVISALALIQGGIEYAKTNPGYIAKGDRRSAFRAGESNKITGGNQSRSRGVQSTDGAVRLGRTENAEKVNSDTKHPNNQGAFSVAPVEAPGSIKSWIKSTAEMIGMKAGVITQLEKNVKDTYSQKQAEGRTMDDSLPFLFLAHSVNYVAKKSEVVRIFFEAAQKAMRRQLALRKQFDEAWKKLKSLMNNREDLQTLSDLLFMGDCENQEYSEAELKENGYADNIISAYKIVRDNLAKAYQLINDARMQVKTRNKTIKANDLQDFMKENFIDAKDIISKQELDDGKILVTYRGCKVYSDSMTVTEDVLKGMEANDNIYVKSKKKLSDGVYKITYNERPAPLNRIAGYMPHMFHRFMVYEVLKDAQGNDVRVAVGTAQSLKGAVDIANSFARGNSERNFEVDAHSFNQMMGEDGVVVGDQNYQDMAKALAQSQKMSISEARKFLHDSTGAKLKNRHRFFGHTMHRTGAEGYEIDLLKVLQHYSDSAARYVALEEWKPYVISMYERFFGDFNADPSTLKGTGKRETARYIRKHIMDVNGVPRDVEQFFNKWLPKVPILGRFAKDTFNGRPALAFSSNLSWLNATTSLGIFNPASAMLNFMQFINIGTMLNSYKYAWMGVNKALKPSEFDKLILTKSGVLEQLNNAADAGGYYQNMSVDFRLNPGDTTLGKAAWIAKNALNAGMVPFSVADGLMRKAAVLGAYYQGVQEKGMKPDNGQQISAKAMQYAREVNDEANFIYDSSNTPEMIRMGSVITQQAFQFQKYPIMQSEFFVNHVIHAKNNAQRARFLLPYVFLTGLPGMIPFGNLLAQFINIIASAFQGDDDDDLTKEIKAGLMRAAADSPFAKAMVESVYNGPLAGIFGVDISERAGMQNFFEGRYYGRNKPESFGGAVGTTLGGPAYSKITNFLDQWKYGNSDEAVKAISPALGNVIQAYVGKTHTTHHRIASTYDTAYERILHAAGFRHIDETNTAFINDYLYRSKKVQQEDKKFIMDAYLDDPSPENLYELRSRGITDKELKKYEEGRNKSNKDRSAGDEPKKKSKKPKTEAQKKDDELRQWNK